jgi:hypothetical protein
MYVWPLLSEIDVTTGHVLVPVELKLILRTIRLPDALGLVKATGNGFAGPENVNALAL